MLGGICALFGDFFCKKKNEIPSNNIGSAAGGKLRLMFWIFDSLRARENVSIYLDSELAIESELAPFFLFLSQLPSNLTRADSA